MVVQLVECGMSEEEETCATPRRLPNKRKVLSDSDEDTRITPYMLRTPKAKTPLNLRSRPRLETPDSSSASIAELPVSDNMIVFSDSESEGEQSEPLMDASFYRALDNQHEESRESKQIEEASIDEWTRFVQFEEEIEGEHVPKETKSLPYSLVFFSYCILYHKLPIPSDLRTGLLKLD